MASSTKDHVAVGEDWIDLVAEVVALASVNVSLAVRGSAPGAEFELVCGGAAEPAGDVIGQLLYDTDVVTVNSDHLWVRAVSRGGRVVPTVL